MQHERERGGGGKGSELPPSGQGYRSGNKISRKVSDAAIYGFNRPREMEEMRPEKEPLKIDDGSIPPGKVKLMAISNKQITHCRYDARNEALA